MVISPNRIRLWKGLHSSVQLNEHIIVKPFLACKVTLAFSLGVRIVLRIAREHHGCCCLQTYLPVSRRHELAAVLTLCTTLEELAQLFVWVWKLWIVLKIYIKWNVSSCARLSHVSKTPWTSIGFHGTQSAYLYWVLQLRIRIGISFVIFFCILLYSCQYIV